MVRDRIAALMIRAATTGGFDYSRADPYDSTWRLRHKLVLQDVHRQAELQVCQAAHNHWLAYASHSNLEPDSWKNIKERAAEALTALQHSLIPWRPVEENKSKKDTINSKYGKLIAQYKAMVARKAAEREAAKKAEETKNDATTPQDHS